MSKKGTLPYDLVLSPSIVRSKCQSLVNIHVAETPLYDGKTKGKSVVYPACLPTDKYNCPYVIKMKELHQTTDIQRFVTEQFFAQYVYEECTRDRRLKYHVVQDNVTPKIHDVWICGTSTGTLMGYMVMDREEGTLRQFMERHAKTVVDKDYAAILVQLQAISLLLSDLYIFHKNLTVDNIVYRRQIQTSIDGNGNPPGGIDLFLIDWDEVAWGPSLNVEEVKAAYRNVIQEIIQDLHRIQTQTNKHTSMTRPTFSSSSFDFKDFAPVRSTSVFRPSSQSSFRSVSQSSMPLNDQYEPEEYLPPVTDDDEK